MAMDINDEQSVKVQWNSVEQMVDCLKRLHDDDFEAASMVVSSLERVYENLGMRVEWNGGDFGFDVKEGDGELLLEVEADVEGKYEVTEHF